MNLQYNGREDITAPCEAVWSFVTQPEKVAGCIAEVVDWKVLDAKSFDANVAVAVGPVRGKFKFHVVLEPAADRSSIGLRISGGGFGSVVDLTANGAIAGGPSGTTTIEWYATATMRGPLATVGGRGLDGQARRVISTTFANIRDKLNAAPAQATV